MGVPVVVTKRNFNMMGRRYLFKSFICLYIHLFSANLLAQKDNFPFQQFEKITTENGVSNNTVYEVLQDKKGFLWILTGNGLNRYDGYNFKIYSYDPADSNSLTGGLFYSLVQDKNGVLWFNNETKGIYSFNPVTEKFFHYRRDTRNKNSLMDDGTAGLVVDKAGNIWIATLSGLDKLDPRTNTFTHITHQSNKETSLSNNFISAITIDEDDNLWLVTGEPGLDYFNTQSQKLIQHFNFGSSSNPIEDWNIHAYRANAGRNGNVWIGSRADGLYCYNTRTKKIIHFQYEKNNPYSLSHNGVYKAYEDKNGNLWLATDAAGGSIEFYDHASGRFYHKSMDDIQYLDFLEDNSGKIWIGTMNGIYTCSPTLKKFESYNHVKGDKNSLSSNEVNCFLRDRSGNMLVGTNTVNIFDSVTKKFTPLGLNDISGFLLQKCYVWKLYQDSKNILWIPTIFGLLSYDPLTKAQRWYRFDDKDSTSLGATSCTGIIEDSKGRYWVTTWFGGFEAFDPVSGKFRYFMIHEGGNSISTNTVDGIFEDSRGILYIGSPNGGLITFNPDKETFKIYRHRVNDPNSPSSDKTLNFLESKNGVIWFCGDGGVNAFDPVTEKFRAFTTKDGLCSNVVTSIVADNAGNHWLGTQNGLSCFTPPENPFDSGSKFHFRNYNKRDGLPGNAMTLSAAYKDVDGKLYFGTESPGFFCFRPDDLKDNSFKPPVYITDLKLFNTSIRPHDADSILKQPIELTQQITLSYDQNDLSLEFAALNYIHPEKNQYQYKLENYNKDWITTDANKRFASYTNLNPGKYVFRVRASNNDGVWSPHEASLIIIITPPFWQTWWFRTLVVLAVAALVYGIYRYRLSHILRLQNIRNRIAADLHDDIGSTLNSISVYSEVAKKDQDGKMEALEMIGQSSRKVIDAMSDIVWTINPENDSFEKIILRMRSISYNLLRAKQIDFSFKADENLNGLKLSLEERRNFYLIFKEALNNLVKYSNAKRASVLLSKNSHHICLLIRDDGVGFDTTRKYNGNGLINMKKRAKEIKAEFSIDSGNGIGTNIELKLKT
ncbi:MAG TPA: two-component regulator propeller domain-containing protein [Chitinophagaceae bacterium]|nr:two-component regulator propeller domain-containing protein [Chitinophagaceae bacterium]